eukprot:scaffold53338_cov67-Phaeocystis_antarctica.AAC.2
MVTRSMVASSSFTFGEARWSSSISPKLPQKNASPGRHATTSDATASTATSQSMDSEMHAMPPASVTAAAITTEKTQPACLTNACCCQLASRMPGTVVLEVPRPPQLRRMKARRPTSHAAR